MKIKCDLCGGELQMDAGGQTASCVDCGMKHSIERVREKLATHEAKEPSDTDEKPIAEEIFDSEWEPVEPETYEAEWEDVLDPDESYYTRYLRFSARMLEPWAVSTPWKKIEWDIFSSNNCEFSIEFRDDVLEKLFPAEYALYQQQYAKAQKPSEQIDAMSIIMDKTAFNVALTPEQLEKLDSLLEAFINCEASVINPLEPVFEMELNYPNHDVKHQIRGSIDEENEVLMELVKFLLEIFHRNFKERYPEIRWYE